MTMQNDFFEYRAWPLVGTSHLEALHLVFGLGVSEVRTDTYILLPDSPQCFMVIRGGRRFEIKVKTTIREPVSSWTTMAKSAFPLRRGVVRTLQAAFPAANLSRRLDAPVDLLSWIGTEASVFTVSKRMVRFEHGDCSVELTQLKTLGHGAETFSLTARRYNTLLATLGMIAGPRMANLDYGTWLRRRFLGRQLAERTGITTEEVASSQGSSGGMARLNLSQGSMHLMPKIPTILRGNDMSFSDPYLPRAT